MAELRSKQKDRLSSDKGWAKAGPSAKIKTIISPVDVDMEKESKEVQEDSRPQITVVSQI